MQIQCSKISLSGFYEVSRVIKCSLRWLRLCIIEYYDPISGSIRQWETVERNHPPKEPAKTFSSSVADDFTHSRSNDIDAVDIIAIIPEVNVVTPSLSNSISSGARVVLVSQYRPPLQKVCLEFPAGLVDSDSAVNAAIRELREETGYVGKPFPGKHQDSTSPVCSYESGMSNTTFRFVTLFVDPNSKENQHPQQECEDGEHILVHVVKLCDLLHFIESCAATQNMCIDGKLYAFATSLRLLCN